MKRRDLLLSALIILLLSLVLSVNRLIMGDSRAISLADAAPLSGQIAQVLATKDSTNNQGLPVYGKDFTIKSTQYFDSNAWVVASITVKGNGGIVVLKLQDGIYTAVLGPGTAFPQTVLQAFPADVSQYLVNNGAIYVPLS